MLVTSQRRPMWPEPISAAALAASFSSRSRITTRAPCSAKTFAVALPIPRSREAPAIGSAPCRERMWQYVEILVEAASLKQKTIQRERHNHIQHKQTQFH